MRISPLACAAALLGASCFALAADRFRPADPNYTVLQLPGRAAADGLIGLELRHSVYPRDAAIATQLAQRYTERARELREPRYFGRAEALLRPWIGAQRPPVAMLLVQADVLQHRHDFAGALSLLDRALAQEPKSVPAHLMRASVLLVQGQFAQMRTDCTVLLAAGESALGMVCLAQVLGSTGQLGRAYQLIQSTLARENALAPNVRSWALQTLADLADRQGDGTGAERHLRLALSETPNSEAVRTLLSDLLLARGAYAQALEALALPNPSIGVLVRRAIAQSRQRDPALQTTLDRIGELLRVGAQRGERAHLREEALLALEVSGDDAGALGLAKANFESQRETIDLRLLATAASKSRDDAALRLLTQWLAASRFEDHITDAMLLRARTSPRAVQR